jgi:hypothetical protein
MVQPINYGIQAPSAFESLVSGLKLGTSLQEMQAQREQRALQAQKLQQDMEMRQKQQEQLQLLRAKPFNQWTSEDVTSASMFMPKEGLTFLQQQMSSMSADQRRARALQLGQLASVTLMGDKERTAAAFDQMIEAETNPREKAALMAQRQTALSNPEELAKMYATMLPGLGDEGKEVASNLLKTRQLTPEAKLAAARAQYADVLAENEIAKAAAEARKLGLESDKLVQEVAEAKRKLASGPELESDARKLVNDSVTSSMASRSLASQYESLANNISVELASGVRARGEEAVRRFFGSEGQVTRLRQEYLRLRNSQVIQNLPPGVASDRDIQVALEAFPPETADPDLLVRFLRGTAKLQRYDSALASAKAEWTAQNGSLGRSRRDLTVMGQAIPAGSNFDQTIGSLLPNVDVLDVEGVAQPGGQAPAAVTAPARPAATTQPVRGGRDIGGGFRVLD